MHPIGKVAKNGLIPKKFSVLLRDHCQVVLLVVEGGRGEDYQGNGDELLR